MKSFGIKTAILLILSAAAILMFQNFTYLVGGKMADIDLEDGTKITIKDEINQRTGAPEKRPYIVQKLPEPREFSTTQDTGTDFKVWLSPTVHYPDTREESYGLAFIVEPDTRISTPEVTYKSKIEVDVAKFNDNYWNERFNNLFTLRNYDSYPRYLGFAFKMDPDSNKYQIPDNWALHMQVWQCCTGIQPPLVLQVLHKDSGPNGEVKFVVIKRNDNHVNLPHTSTNGERLSFSGPIAGQDYISLNRGVWYRFVFRFLPNPDITSNTGKIAIWLDGVKILDHTGAWGYTAITNDDVNIIDSYSVKLGIYRGVPNTKQQFYFDNIRWATTYCGADPTPDQTSCPSN